MLKRKSDKFLKKAQERMKTWNELMEERGTRKDMPMKPQVVTYTLNKLLKDDAIVSSDSGTIATWTARQVEMRGDDAVFSLRLACDHGQRPALQHRRGGRLSRPAGSLRRRRWWTHDAHGRDRHAGEIQPARHA